LPLPIATATEKLKKIKSERVTPSKKKKPAQPKFIFFFFPHFFFSSKKSVFSHFSTIFSAVSPEKKIEKYRTGKKKNVADSGRRPAPSP
jgi:hypothetical protein